MTHAIDGRLVTSYTNYEYRQGRRTMRVYHSEKLGDVRLTEEQYHKLLRRFNPNKELGKEYKQPCICPPGPDGLPFMDCSSNCKTFKYRQTGCLRYIREIGDNLWPNGSLGSRLVCIYNKRGRDIISHIHNTLLGMQRK